MIKTRMTELFGIKHPIMMSGMNFVTEPKLVAAACNAGGLGVLAIGRYPLEGTREAIREIRKLTDKPFGINQAMTIPHARENIQVAIDEKVPIINYSLGKPWFIDQVHAYGGKVVGTIAIARHAIKAEQLGVDAIVATGHEAAAHGGSATSMVLIPLVASMVKVPVIAAGGFYDGRGLAAALALGASGVSMGTRFMMTKECIVHDNFKALIMKSTEQDTIYSTVFDGMPSRAFKSEATELIQKRGHLLLTESIPAAMRVKKKMDLTWKEFIAAAFGQMKGEEKLSLFQQAQKASVAMRVDKAIYEGDTKNGVMFSGQDCGGIKDVPTCKELIDRVIAEAEGVLASGNQFLQK